MGQKEHAGVYICMLLNWVHLSGVYARPGLCYRPLHHAREPVYKLVHLRRIGHCDCDASGGNSLSEQGAQPVQHCPGHPYLLCNLHYHDYCQLHCALPRLRCVSCRRCHLRPRLPQHLLRRGAFAQLQEPALCAARRGRQAARRRRKDTTRGPPS